MTDILDYHYDAYLAWLVTERCNLDCAYCSSKQYEKDPDAHFSEIDIAAAMKTLDSSNKTFLIALTGGGEPFMASNMLELCKELTKKHYLIINTNLTSPKIREFAETIDPKRVFYLMASVHIKELERLGLLDRYIDNYTTCKVNGFRVLTEEVAHPTILQEVEIYLKLFESRGVELAFGPFCGEYNGKMYPTAYTAEEKRIFGLKDDIRERFYQKDKLCNAGYNAGGIGFTGDMHPCFPLANTQKIGNIYQGFEFYDRLKTCPLDYCSCPTNAYFPDLFNRAVQEENERIEAEKPKSAVTKFRNAIKKVIEWC
jgi:MoaA/NifB/PqqE/SkfB family radical SAM enzyme